MSRKRQENVKSSVKNRKGRITSRKIFPGDLVFSVAKASVWYLVGMVEQEYRVFRASRIRSGKITDQASTHRASFDLAVFWEQWSEHVRKQVSSSLRRYPVLVRVAPTLVPHLVLRYGEEIEKQIEQAAPPDTAG